VDCRNELMITNSGILASPQGRQCCENMTVRRDRWGAFLRGVKPRCFFPLGERANLPDESEQVVVRSILAILDKH
jgi:hypothetical protein